MAEVNKSKKKIVIFALIFFFLLSTAFAIIFIISLNQKKGGSTSEDHTQEKAESLNRTLLTFINNQIDAEDGLNKKEAIYDVDKLVSFKIDNSYISYSSYNDNYVFTLSMKLNDINDIEKSINVTGYSEVDIRMKEVVKSENNPLLMDADFKANINGNNYVSVLNKPNDMFRDIDMTYLGKDNKYYSLNSYRYKVNEFNIEGVEENLFSISETNNPIIYKLLKMMII